MTNVLPFASASKDRRIHIEVRHLDALASITSCGRYFSSTYPTDKPATCSECVANKPHLATVHLAGDSLVHRRERHSTGVVSERWTECGEHLPLTSRYTNEHATCIICAAMSDTDVDS